MKRRVRRQFFCECCESRHVWRGRVCLCRCKFPAPDARGLKIRRDFLGW